MIAAAAVLLGSPASGAAAQSNTLESILVTANRQQSELADIAFSIFAVDQESLEAVQHVHPNEALARVPGTWVSRGNGQEHLTAIRSPVLTGAGSCGAFQMSQDNIPLRAAGFCNVNMLFEANTEQAARIEVIRGPGSVLYGANALHGTINVISAEVSEEAEGSFAVDFGPHNYQRIKASRSDSDGRQGFRINFNAAADDGYKDDSGFGQQKFGVRHQYEGETFTVASVFNAANLNQETAGFIQGPEVYKSEALKTSNPNPEAFRDAESYRFHSRVQWRTEAGDWRLTPYYRKTDMDFLMHFLPGAPLEENGHESLGLQGMFAGRGKGGIQWLAGLDLEFTKGYLKQTQAGPPDTSSAFLINTLPAGKQYDFEVRAKLLSPFAQVHVQASDRSRFTLGLRYERLAYDYDNRMLAGRTRDNGTPCGFGGCRYSRPADRGDRFDNVSVQAGWIHDLVDQQQFYANLSRAFRAPQANEMYRLQNAQTVADLDSEEADSLELGYRASRERISYAVAAYYMKKDNVIFQDSDRNNVSSGQTEHKGLEFNAALSLRERLSLSLAGSYGRHVYAGNIAPRGVTVVIDGNDIDTAPRLTGSAQLRWELSADRSLELEWIFMDSYYTDEANLHQYEGHNLVNLRYQASARDGWFYGARITNLLDVDYAERADFAFGQDRYFVGEPASLYVTAGRRF